MTSNDRPTIMDLLAERHAALHQHLADTLDLQQGLREVLLAERHAQLADTATDNLDLDAGLAAILGTNTKRLRRRPARLDAAEHLTPARPPRDRSASVGVAAGAAAVAVLLDRVARVVARTARAIAVRAAAAAVTTMNAFLADCSPTKAGMATTAQQRRPVRSAIAGLMIMTLIGTLAVFLPRPLLDHPLNNVIQNVTRAVEGVDWP